MHFPKNCPPQITILFLVWGFTSSTVFDFTIGGGLLDFYKVNDSNKYELTDLMTYFLFATFSNFFIYFYEVLNITKKLFIPLYTGMVRRRVAYGKSIFHNGRDTLSKRISNALFTGCIYSGSDNNSSYTMNTSRKKYRGHRDRFIVPTVLPSSKMILHLFLALQSILHSVVVIFLLLDL